MEDKTAALRLFLRVYGTLSLMLFSALLIGFTFRIPILDQGGMLHWAIWDEVSGHVGPMLFVIYLVWSIFLIKAANRPQAYASFLEFTMWANLAHALFMVPQALGSHHDQWKLLTDVPWLLLLAGGLAVLRPKLAPSEVGDVGSELPPASVERSRA